jgi:hypothetical protein
MIKVLVMVASLTIVILGCTLSTSRKVQTNPKLEALDPATKELFNAKPAEDLPGPVIGAKNVLARELNRRFSDFESGNFGMARVTKLGERSHSGPSMNIQGSGLPQTRRQGEYGEEYLIEDTWISENDIRPVMVPENAAERAVVETARRANHEFAIYTMGRFDLDDGGPVMGKFSGPGNFHYNTLAWGNGRLRGRGPAYLTIFGKTAPRVHTLVDFARRAWKSGKREFVEQGDQGWTLFGRRAIAPDICCAKCHGPQNRVADGIAKKTKGLVQKPGDAAGLYIIAIKG